MASRGGRSSGAIIVLPAGGGHPHSSRAGGEGGREAAAGAPFSPHGGASRAARIKWSAGEGGTPEKPCVRGREVQCFLWSWPVGLEKCRCVCVQDGTCQAWPGLVWPARQLSSTAHDAIMAERRACCNVLRCVVSAHAAPCRTHHRIIVLLRSLRPGAFLFLARTPLAASARPQQG